MAKPRFSAQGYLKVCQEILMPPPFLPAKGVKPLPKRPVTEAVPGLEREAPIVLRPRTVRTVLMLFIAACATACSGQGNPPAHAAMDATSPNASLGTSRTLVLHAYDSNGNRLTWQRFRALQNNGHPSGGNDDTLVDPVTLRVITMWPLFSTGSAGGDPELQLPARACALTLAWPTSDGYSNLIVDLPAGGGTAVFNELAAAQAIAGVRESLTARPWYAPSPAVRAASAAAATRDYSAALAATSEPATGKWSARALDAAVHAEVLLLAESGRQYFTAHHAGNAPAWSVTFDEIAGGAHDLGGFAKLLAPNVSNGYVRIVFDPTQSAGYYANEVTAAHALGLHVLGEILDSSAMKRVGYAAFRARVASYVATLPSVDEWEVGNEVNGSWLGSDVVAKVSYAAQYVKAHTHARTLLTLYWVLGEDTAKDSMFSWAAANLSPSLLARVDDVGISLYPEESPLGGSFDRVMAALHARFPQQRIGITELGYLGPGTGRTWTWGSAGLPASAARIDVATYYQTAVYAFPYSLGGTYWWYYLEDMRPQGPLWRAMSALHASML
jgi:hypothetical protein